MILYNNEHGGKSCWTTQYIHGLKTRKNYDYRFTVAHEKKMIIICYSAGG